MSELGALTGAEKGPDHSRAGVISAEGILLHVLRLLDFALLLGVRLGELFGDLELDGWIFFTAHDQTLFKVKVLAGCGDCFDFKWIAAGLGLKTHSGEHNQFFPPMWSKVRSCPSHVPVMDSSGVAGVTCKNIGTPFTNFGGVTWMDHRAGFFSTAVCCASTGLAVAPRYIARMATERQVWDINAIFRSVALVRGFRDAHSFLVLFILRKRNSKAGG